MTSLNVVGAYDKIAPQWDAEYTDNRAKAENLSVFSRIKREGYADGMVLDLACGTGMMLDYLPDVSHVAYRGVDLSEQMIETAERKHPHHRFAVADMNAMDSLQPTHFAFDSILCTFCGVSHVRDPGSFLHECFIRLAPGGRVFLMPFGMGTAKRSAYHVKDPEGVALRRLPWTENEAYRWMDCAGFVDIDVRGMTSWSAGITEKLPLPLARLVQGLDNMTTGRSRPDDCLFLIVTGRKPE